MKLVTFRNSHGGRLAAIDVVGHTDDQRAGRRVKTPLTRTELKRTGLERLKTPRRCDAGHLCYLWPCIECTPAAAAKLQSRERS